MMEISEPQRRFQEIRIQRERALESRLRDVILREHERRHARAEAQARVTWVCIGGFRERLEGIAETSALDCCRARAGERRHIARTGVRRSRGDGEEQQRWRDQTSDQQGCGRARREPAAPQSSD